MMWRSDQIAVEIADAEHPETIVVNTTPIGIVSIMASVSIVGRVLCMEGAHIGGLQPGSLGRAGLNAIGRKLMELADVDEIIVQGSTRTTGRYKGRTPSSIRFPR